MGFKAINDYERKLTDVLTSLRDEKYLEFNARLIPTVEKERIIGVRIPDLRRLARKIKKEDGGENLLKLPLPHYYYEEMNVHAFLLEQIEDFDRAVKLVDEFLPYVDNWATCDSLSPKVFKKNPERLAEIIPVWLKSDSVYTVRFAIVMLLNNYLKSNFKPVYLEWVSQVHSDDYYINMAAAWYFSMALVYRYDETLPYFTQHRLDKSVHNKAIQKARESRKIMPEIGAYLNTLKIR